LDYHYRADPDKETGLTLNRREPLTSEQLQTLIAGRRPGHALPREFYTDPAIFELDLERMLLTHWFCVGHASSIARSGDYLIVELGAESVIVVRTPSGEIRALLNVCRHRGSRLLSGPSGRAVSSRLTCPYHAWSYDLDGNLLAARRMGEPFQAGRLSLRGLPVRIAEGLIFCTFSDKPLDFAAAEDALRRSAGVYGWSRAKVAHRELYSIQANWKLAIENYMECYHCQPAHPEFSKHHDYARPAELREDAERAGRRRSELLGVAVPDIDRYGCEADLGHESCAVMPSALLDGASSATADGGAASRLMGSFSAFDGNSTYFDIGPLSDFLAYPDHGVVYRFIPRSVNHTEMELLWLVDEAAVEGEDYEIERLTWLWKTTSAQDKRIVEMNQAGINSRFFQPGPYSTQEAFAERFVEWYLDELSAGTRQS
jgi:phenylpropionate dioxygenase-like ring-hydroxylating dioxygenase large terminal subunit